MNMPAIKTESATAFDAPKTPAGSAMASAPVVTMTPKRPPRAEKIIKMAKEAAVRVVPPLIVITLLMVFWELVCRRAGSALPPPSKVYQDTKELIFDPFFDRGGIDK
ncbi:MAG: nitrate ABC transporter, permease protein, partial [Microvirga sp.]